MADQYKDKRHEEMSKQAAELDNAVSNGQGQMHMSPSQLLVIGLKPIG